MPTASLAAEKAAAPSTVGAMLQSFFALLLVLAVIAGAAWLLKRTQQLQGVGTQALKSVSAIAVGAKERVVIVEVGETWLVLGVAPGQVHALHTMAKQELPAAPSPMAPKFAEWLAKARKGGRA
ncbi:MAG TPA: flagellar biosynthetic protein FliO [Burkholderiales bacterium]|nr:flagellar biosynthetic protein FliO [Burkholderiales bacterium]